MSISENNLISPAANKRSPFSLSILEIALALLVGTATWFGLGSFIRSTLPFLCGSAVNGVPIDCGWTEAQAWQTLGYPLFSTYAIPLVSFLGISAIFLVRSIRQDVHHFSVFGHLSLAWPVFSFLGFFVLSSNHQMEYV